MLLHYLVDENLRGPLWRAIQLHNSRGQNPLDVVRVGDAVDLPLGIEDPEILLWAEREQRILVTLDQDSMPAYLAEHLDAGHHSPGIFMIRRHSTLQQIVSFLIDAAYASGPEEWQDQVSFIP
jgi:predicted nuclease of predicted toxin-antitoxin system